MWSLIVDQFNFLGTIRGIGTVFGTIAMETAILLMVE